MSRPWFLSSTAAAAGGPDESAEMLEACARGDVELVQRLLDAGHAVVYHGQFFGETPCEQALEHAQLDVASLLLASLEGSGAREEVSELFWRQLMLAAMKSGRPEALAFVLDFDPDLNGSVRRAELPLFDAVRRGSAEMAKLLLASGADPRARDLTGNSLLHIAAKYNSAQLLPLLHASTARELVNAEDQQGNTALHYAAEAAQYAVARALIADFKADANVPNRRQMRPLHFAIDKSRPRLVRLLLDEGHADVNAQDVQGNTPLVLLTGLSASDLDEYAGSDNDGGDGSDGEDYEDGGDEDDTVSMLIARLLIARGADVNVANAAGMAPLHQAMRRFDMDMMGLLIAHGADVNGVNAFGDTPLHHAARLAMFPAIWQLLLRHGARLDALDRDGKTPLELVPNDQLRVAITQAIAASQRAPQT